MLDREANGGPPNGRALDLGTGSGIWGIELARRGWEVTGVNHVEEGPAARPRAHQRGGRVKKQLLRGDVTPLRDAAGGMKADHIARHRRAVRAWDRGCGRMVS